MNRKLVCVIYLMLAFSCDFATAAFGGGPAPASDPTAFASVERLLGNGAEVLRAGTSTRTTLKLMDTLRENDTIYTNATTSLILRLGDGSKINIGYSTEFTILASVKNGSVWSSSFHLVVGWVRALVQGDGTGSIFKLKIHTPSATAGVRGTEFSVEHAAGKTTVHVLSGTVYVGPANATNTQLTHAITANRVREIIDGAAGDATSFSLSTFIVAARARGYMKLATSASPTGQTEVPMPAVPAPSPSPSPGPGPSPGPSPAPAPSPSPTPPTPPSPPSPPPPTPPTPFDDTANRAWFCRPTDTRAACVEARTNRTLYATMGCIGVYGEPNQPTSPSWGARDWQYPSLQWGTQPNPRRSYNRYPGQSWYNTADGYNWSCLWATIQWIPTTQ